MLAIVLFAGTAVAEDLVSLDWKITGVEQQIFGLTKQYEKQKSDVDRSLARIEQEKMQGNTRAVDSQTKAAYAATERLNQQLAQINQLKQTREQLCGNWRAAYRKNVDDLLQKAEQEPDKAKKAEIGKSLQKNQTRNSELCAESQQAALSNEWRALKVESYDGPQEIADKLELLEDISREISIGVARMDQRYQEALREEKTRERAQEFVQEGTLFTEGMSVHPGSPAQNTTFGVGYEAVPTPGGLDPAGFVDRSAGPEGQSGMAQIPSQADWLAGGNSQQREKEYKKTREALMLEQKEIHQKIQEFEHRAKDLTLP
jgi:hypothetical protein